MAQIDYDHLFRTCVILCQFSNSKTINTKMLQCAYRILYNADPLAGQAVSNATKYVTIYYSSENYKMSDFKKASKFKKSLKKFLDTTGQDLYLCEYRIGGNVPFYLCGLDDVYDNTYKAQLASLKEDKTKTKTKTKVKKEEPTPEDAEEEDEQIDLDDEDDEDYVPDEEEEEEEEQVKPKSSKSKSTKPVKSKSANI